MSTPEEYLELERLKAKRATPKAFLGKGDWCHKLPLQQRDRSHFKKRLRKKMWKVGR
jgi:hypothetical protein